MVEDLWESIITPQPVFVIAEAGVNHNGDSSLAKEMIDAAAGAGADAVKFQTFKAERLASRTAPKAGYQLKHTDAAESQFHMLKRLEISEKVHVELMEYCKKKDIVFLSSAFDETCVDFLLSLGVAVFKIPSGEITNLPYLRHLASKGKPMIMSTGMAVMEEIDAALNCLEDTGNRKVVLLQCVSNYPASYEDVNLRAMSTIADTFHVPVGYSDHTPGIEIPLAAAAMGACVIEKHFTMDRKLKGPDHAASLEPPELEQMIRGIRHIEKALGNGEKIPATSERDTALVARKSLVATRDIFTGEILTRELIAAKRPGTGLPPSMLTALTGRRAVRDIREGTLLSVEMIQ